MVTRSEATDSMFDYSIHKPGNIQISNSKPSGMKNELFFCYMNASVQTLLGISRLSDYACKEKYQAELNTKNPKFWRAFAEIIYQNSKGANIFTPRLLRKILQDIFDQNIQHDAHEFIRIILSGMQDEINLKHPQKEVEF